MQDPGERRSTNVSKRPEINSLLVSMALDEVFDIVEDARTDAGTAREVPQQSVDRETLSRTLLDAHRALMDLSQHNREMFRDVVASLEKNSSDG